MNYTQNALLLSILLIPTIFFATEKDNFAHIKNNKNNVFKKKMCGGISGASTLATLGQFLNSGFSVPESFFGAITTGVGSYFLCSKVANIPDPFEDFKKIYKK